LAVGGPLGHWSVINTLKTGGGSVNAGLSAKDWFLIAQYKAAVF
jgi:hypothetical protein